MLAWEYAVGELASQVQHSILTTPVLATIQFHMSGNAHLGYIVDILMSPNEI